jgi:hypothetical protein
MKSSHYLENLSFLCSQELRKEGGLAGNVRLVTGKVSTYSK